MRQSGPSHKIFSFNNLGFLACLVAMALILAGGTAAARIPYLTNEEQIRVLTLQELGEAVVGYKLAHGSYPEPFNQLIPVMDLGLALGADGDGYPHLDPWGQPILYWSDGVDYALVSYGADTMPDQEYADLTAEQFTADDLVWVNGDFAKVPQTFQPAITLGKQKQTMADMRSIATCIRAYGIDNGSIPDSSGLFVPVETFRTDFEPVYIRSLLLTDAWGNPFLVLSDGAEHYTIVSTGEDGVREEDYDEATSARRPATAAADIVFRDGFFLQWPIDTAQ